MRYFLASSCVLKRLESPFIYNVATDELYEIDEDAFSFLRRCADAGGCDRRDGDSEFLEYALREGILTTEGCSVRRPSVQQAPTPSLRHLELQVTNRCNLRCRHCFLGDTVGQELSVWEVMNILREFEAMQGLRLLITGGEPLLHKGFADINRLLPDFGFRKVLFSNGLLLSTGLLRSLNVDEIQVSIDGMEEGHDALRGKGTWGRGIEALRMAIDAEFDVSVSTMVHRGNLDDFDRMEELFREVGIKDWTVDVPCPEGNLKNNLFLSADPEVSGKFLRYGFGDGSHGGGEGFACGLHLAAVIADGRVARCSFYADESVGTVSEGLEPCWKRIIPTRLSELECNCNLLETCRGGCRYRAKLFGNHLGRDLCRCAAYGIDPVRPSC